MKIDPTTPVRTSPTRRTRRAQGGGNGASFASQVAEPDTATAPSVAGSSAPVAVNPLLAVQEVADATSGAAKSKAQGEAILDRLDDIKMGLLAGFIPRDRLEDLVRLVRNRQAKAADDALEDVLDAIELRAQVELAKLSIES